MFQALVVDKISNDTPNILSFNKIFINWKEFFSKGGQTKKITGKNPLFFS